MSGHAAPTRPKLSARYQATAIPGDAVAFVGENGSAVVRNALAHDIVPLIDGVRTSEEIAGSLAPAAERWQVLSTLSELAHAGLIVEATEMGGVSAALWAELGLSEFRAGRVLADACVGIERLSPAPLGPLHDALADFGFRVAETADLATIRLVICDDYLDPALPAVDERARATGQPWLAIKPTGVNVWVGPVLAPGGGPCWHCLAERLHRNRPVDAQVARRRRAGGPPPSARGHTRVAAQHAFSLAATTLAQWCAATPASPRLRETLIVVETVPLAVSEHIIRRRPQCPACGDPARALPPAHAPDLEIDRRPVRSLDGAERRESPDATFQRLAHLISPVTGIVSAVRPSVWNARSPIRTYSAGHNHAFSNDSLRSAADSLRALSSGKGRTDAQARASALCEALERYSGVFTGGEPRRSATLDELGDSGVDPRDCMQFSERQYRERERWLAAGSPFQIVPHEFDAGMPLEWSPVWSLTRQTVRYLPTGYLFYGYPQDLSNAVVFADSNGNAAGVTRVEACQQGLYELIERDGVAIWWYNRIPRPGIDLSGGRDPWIDELRGFLAEVGREVWALDLTSDLGVPTVAALSRRVDGPDEQIVMGFGAHHDPAVALGRALTEMCQFLPAALGLEPDGRTEFPVSDRDTVRWWRTAHVDDQPYLAPLRSVPAVSPQPAADGAAPAPTEAFRRVVDGLEARGLEVMVLDQTRPDVGLPVVKVIVPGLRHFWARFAPGRLYDVPVALGWIPRATPEAELNPVAMFL